MCAMSVGYARMEITPQESVPLAGYGNSSARFSQTILDPLYATCIAFVNDVGEKALVYTVDLLNAGLTTTTEIRPAISAKTGIPVDFIQVSGTHTHAAPDTQNEEAQSMVRYLKFYKQQMVQAAVEALADVKPATLFLTRTTTKNLNFVRHYIMEDGTYAGPNFGDLSKLAVGHIGDPDPEMQLAKITREGGKDIVICNFGVHQTDTGGMKKYDVSADIAGAMRAQMEQETGCHFAYFTGACGNVVPNSRIDKENVVERLDYIAHGKALAKYAMDAAGTYESSEFGGIRAISCEVEYEINHGSDHMKDKATEVYELFRRTNDRLAGNELAKQYGFSSVYHAGAVMRRTKMADRASVPLAVLCVGDLAFALAPYEMFGCNGMQLKEGSPFKMTMVLTLANRASLGYLPAKKAFEYSSYEGDTCRFKAGIGERLTQEFVSMLKELND